MDWHVQGRGCTSTKPQRTWMMNSRWRTFLKEVAERSIFGYFCEADKGIYSDPKWESVLRNGKKAGMDKLV